MSTQTDPPAEERTATEAESGRAPGQGSGGSSRRGLTLFAVLLAVFVVPTSISGTAVALPGIGADTHASLISLQWVVNAFNVAFACFTLVWGSVADIVGRVRAFALGAGVYALASLAGALSANVVLLDVTRALAGLGGAAIFSCGSAILSTVFDGAARARAFALFGTVAGAGVAVGPSLSGLLVEGLGWRSVFGLHAAALAVVLLAVPAMARNTPAARREGARIDVAGSALFVAAMALLTTGIVQGSQWGWAGPGVLGLFAGAAVVLAAFAVVEKRHSSPMLDLGLMADRRFLALCLVPVAASFGFVTMLTYLPSYLTTVTGYSSGKAGLVMVLLTLPVLLCPMLAARLVSRGVRALTVIRLSLVCLVVGDIALNLFSADVAVVLVAVPMLVTGAGMGLSAGLVDGQALEIVEPGKAGMAAGFLNTLRLGSEAVAVAVYGSLLATVLSARVREGIGAYADAGDPSRVANQVAGGDVSGPAQAVAAGERGRFTDFLAGAYDSAFHTVLWILAVVCLVLLAVITVLLRTGRNDRPHGAR
ncbi:MFS transporter [Streptomyces sp. HNM0575]|uniref:MFS transporter n=1 Tax=Streptomyces sp. HNM0575 TaxID=2716338 RepID=UPI00145C9768|nr:MFS transporter [Streptomyces sp. HNM0575]NLU71996.1 MFS transporter [Streptomyces sp. HNM0575]